MASYCILETEGGWTVVERPQSGTAEEAAHRIGGIVIDPGPYDSYEDACEALEALQAELDTTNGGSDIPGAQPPESREETPG